MGLSLTAGSAVWVLVDTYDGSIIADEVVDLDTVGEISRAAARSVQEFALQSERLIDGVRLVWTEDARHEGVRLRTKLRLFGFEAIDTVSEEAAREGRNRTARHIAPHMVLAYGAARADLDDPADKGVLLRLAEKVPSRNSEYGAGAPVIAERVAAVRVAGSEAAMRTSDRARQLMEALPGGVGVRAAAAVFAVAVTGVVGYALFGYSPKHDVPQPAVAEAVAPAPAAIPEPVLPAVVEPAPIMVEEVAIPAAVPETAPSPQYSAAVPETAAEVEVSDETSTGTYAAAVPQTTSDVPAATVSPGLRTPEPSTAQTVGAAEIGQQLPAQTGVPHLTGPGPAAGPAQPYTVPAQASPEVIPPPAPPAPGPLGALFGALP
ncbi:hypothetical protein [Mycolicibacterium parafortuitum]|nr:hypothetical protein [Mycolicibacterium parafortuitum]